MFFPLVVKVFGCVHQHAKGFLYQCANMTWGAKSIIGLPLSILHTIYTMML
jgi:hypothetical protein